MGGRFPPQCTTHVYSNPETPYSPWPKADSSRDLGCNTGSARGSPGYKVPCLDVASRPQDPIKSAPELRIRILLRVCRLTLILLIFVSFRTCVCKARSWLVENPRNLSHFVMINFEGRVKKKKERRDFGCKKIDLRPCNQTSQAAGINHHYGRSSHAGHLLVPQIKKEVSELSDAIRAGPPHTIGGT